MKYMAPPVRVVIDVNIARSIDVPSTEAGLLCDEASGTLFCSDLFIMEGDPPAVTDADIVGPAPDFERRMRHFPEKPA